MIASTLSRQSLIRIISSSGTGSDLAIPVSLIELQPGSMGVVRHEDRFPCRFDLVSERRTSKGLDRDQVDRALEQSLQVIDHAKVAICNAGFVVTQIDQKVEIARLLVEGIAHGRTEYVQSPAMTPDADLGERITLTLDQRNRGSFPLRTE